MPGRATVRELARAYAAIAADPVQDEKRELWAAHNSLEPTRIPILAHAYFWQKWGLEYFADSRMQCVDLVLRGLERHFRIALFQFEIGDDTIQEPWYTVPAVQPRGCRMHIHLKDVEHLHGEPDRLKRWVRIARGVCEPCAQ